MFFPVASANLLGTQLTNGKKMKVLVNVQNLVDFSELLEENEGQGSEILVLPVGLLRGLEWHLMPAESSIIK